MKGLNLTLDSWRPHREREVQRIHGEHLKIEDMDSKYQKAEGRGQAYPSKECSKVKGLFKCVEPIYRREEST